MRAGRHRQPAGSNPLALLATVAAIATVWPGSIPLIVLIFAIKVFR